MAWQRDEANLGISGATAYSYTEVDWEVHGDKCTYRHIGGVTSPYNFGATATSTLQWWEGGTWHDYAGPASGTFNGYGDLALVDVEDSFVRQAADRTVSLGCYTTMMGGSARAWIDYTVPHLAPSVTWAASNPVVRNSDNSITLTWDAPSLEYSAMCLEVSTDGGSWSQFAVLWNTATSYTWTGCSADHSYQFRIRTNYLASYSDYDVCATVIVNTPLPPDKLTTQATSGTNVTVTLVNTSPVATSCEYRLGDGTNWGAVVTGQDTQSFSVNMGSDHYLQVRNANATGTSNWRQSSYINTVTKPNKPTLWQPVDGAIVEPGDITFSWNYNSADGSEQTAWELEYTLPMLPTPTTVSSTASTATDKQTTITMNEGWEPYWRVRTKGASSSWSDWSSGRTLRVYSAPTVSIAAITATGMPISISATYSDTHQPYPMGDPITFDCVYAAVTLKSGDRTILTKPATISGTSLSCDISLSDAILENGAEYTIVLDVRSSSGLQASANATFTTAFTEPQAGELQITNDPDTGYASLLATFDNHATDQTYSGATNTQYESTEGYVRILTVEGKSEKWNQLAPSNASYSSQGNKPMTSGASFKAGDKLYLSARYTITSGTNAMSLSVYGYSGTDSNQIFITASVGSSATVETIKTATLSCTSLGTTTLTDGNCWIYAYLNGNTATFDQIKFVNLTAIFGAGNEPATVEAFKATDVYKAKLAAGELYAYDAGSLVSIEGAGVRGRNLLPPISDHSEVGVTWTVNPDKSVTVSGQATANATRDFGRGTLTLDAGTYCTNESANNVGVTVFANTSPATVIKSGGGIFTITERTAVFVRFFVSSGLSVNTTIYPQLELGSTAHAYEPYSLTTITTTLRSAGSVHDQLQVAKTDVKVQRNIGTRSYQSGDESDPDVLTDGTTTYYALDTPTEDTLPDISLIQLGTAATVLTDLDSTFTMTGWDGSADAVSVSVARVNTDGSITPLLEDGQAGAGIVDKYAPLNTPYQYAVTTMSAAHAVNTVYVENEIITDLWFAYWTRKDGDTVTEMTASAKWNPDNGGIQVSRPQKTRVYYAGRKDPVSYDGSAVALNETPSWMLVDREEAQPFVQLIEDGGRGVYKSCDGWVYHADFDLTLSPKYTAIGYYGGIMLSVTRIAGDQL